MLQWVWYKGRAMGVAGANPINHSVRIEGAEIRPMKLESLVTVDQPRYGEYVPGSCTHRPSSRKMGRLEAVLSFRSITTVKPLIGTKSKQGIRRGICGWTTS